MSQLKTVFDKCEWREKRKGVPPSGAFIVCSWEEHESERAHEYLNAVSFGSDDDEGKELWYVEKNEKCSTLVVTQKGTASAMDVQSNDTDPMSPDAVLQALERVLGYRYADDAMEE